MLNDLLSQIREYRMIQPGDRIICAVSGGADSMALLWGMYLLRDKLSITLEAAHFNHGLRGEESDRDAQFVKDFCARFEIPLHTASESVTAGKKGLEAAARDARYAFLDTLPGKIATAHTADDNAETLLMHLIRGTGLKGLGGITPIIGNRIRPMLGITRQQVLAFLEEYHIPHKEDSSNHTDLFLRNRVRHHIMPLLKAENPRISEALSATATRLRRDEEALALLSHSETLPSISALRKMLPALRYRVISTFLKQSGVPEPESEHILAVERLITSQRPSARIMLPGGILIQRNYDILEVPKSCSALSITELPLCGTVTLEDLGLCIRCNPATEIINTNDTFTVFSTGPCYVRSRNAGDRIRLSGGRKSLKKLFVDRKIPASQRLQIPIIADPEGILGVYGIGVNLDRIASTLPALQIRIFPFEQTKKF